MAEAIDTYGTAFKNGSATLLARVVGQDGSEIVQADLNAIHYTVFLLDDQDPDSRAPVANHTDVALTISQVIFNSLQYDALWTIDEIGYNFRHTLDVSPYPAFATAGRRYLVEYRLTPMAGEVIMVRFRINVI